MARRKLPPSPLLNSVITIYIQIYFTCYNNRNAYLCSTRKALSCQCSTGSLIAKTITHGKNASLLRLDRQECDNAPGKVMGPERLRRGEAELKSRARDIFFDGPAPVPSICHTIILASRIPHNQSKRKTLQPIPPSPVISQTAHSIAPFPRETC